jgi:hypothetical protein
MTLTELQNEVYAITNRPDMATQTLSAVRAATLSLHQADYYFKDLIETGLSFETPEFLQQVEYGTIFPRFRSLKYLRKTDASGREDGKFLEILPPELVVDSYSINKGDVAYVAGAILQIRAAAPVQYLLVGYYAHPNITLEAYNSWIAAEHPFAIVYAAAARIFKAVGKDSEYATWTAEAAGEARRVMISNIVATGV